MGHLICYTAAAAAPGKPKMEEVLNFLENGRQPQNWLESLNDALLMRVYCFRINKIIKKTNLKCKLL